MGFGLLFMLSLHARVGQPLALQSEMGAFYWTVQAPDIVNSGREEQGSVRL